jgi:GntR family transcriptional regulator of arabinose operon
MAPKHQIVRDHLEQLILQGEVRPGDTLPGEMELSRDLDVSRNTIRHALDQLSKSYRIERTRGRGTIFHGERGDAAEQKAIGFINSSITYTIYPRMIHGLEEGLFAGGYSMILANGNYDPEKELEAVRRMLAQGVQGIVAEPMISAQLSGESEFVQLLNGAGLPVVTTNCIVPDLSASYITMDDYWIGRRAAEHFLAHGHRRVACVYKSDPNAGGLRASGFRDELRDAGIAVDESLIVEYTQEHEALAPGSWFTRDLLDRADPPTGIFYFNDQIALQAYAFFQEEGVSIPRDLSVIAVDNIAEAAHVRPGLTTFHHPSELIGRLAADTIIHLLSAGNVGTGGYGVSLKPPLVERGSVGRYKR